MISDVDRHSEMVSEEQVISNRIVEILRCGQFLLRLVKLGLLDMSVYLCALYQIQQNPSSVPKIN